MNSLSFFTRASNGGLVLASYHPRSSGTWIWSLMLDRSYPTMRWLGVAARRSGQWHHHLRLPFGRVLYLSRQDYHKELRP